MDVDSIVNNDFRSLTCLTKKIVNSKTGNFYEVTFFMFDHCGLSEKICSYI